MFGWETLPGHLITGFMGRFIFRGKPWGWVIFAFGLGHFVSDLKDFWELKFIGPDEEGPTKFWGID